MGRKVLQTGLSHLKGGVSRAKTAEGTRKRFFKAPLGKQTTMKSLTLPTPEGGREGGREGVREGGRE